MVGILTNLHHCELALTKLIALVMIYNNWFNNAQVDFHFASKDVGNFLFQIDILEVYKNKLNQFCYFEKKSDG
jgi:hypothetical protein